jgi:LacI family gluconate utilization system Gnt-I transcriptional repressor
MDDVARVSGVSQMTVSRAFFNSASIRQETRDRILKVAGELGYYPNRAASSLASRRTRTYGIVLPTLQDSIYLPFVEGAAEVFEANSCDYLLQSIDYAKGRESQAIAALLSHRVEAIMLPSIGHTPATGHFIDGVPIPVIEIGNLPKRPRQYAVGHSDFDAGYMATRRLLENDRRRIALICGDFSVTTNARDRFNGYKKALKEAGINVTKDLVAEVDHSVDAGLDGLARLLGADASFDGLVIGGEIWSAAVLLQVLKNGHRVPRDVAIVGIGKVEIADYLPVTLTHVDLPRRETGAQAAKLAIALSRGEEPVERSHKLPLRLIPKASG